MCLGVILVFEGGQTRICSEDVEVELCDALVDPCHECVAWVLALVGAYFD